MALAEDPDHQVHHHVSVVKEKLSIKEKSKDKLPAYYSFTPLVINYDLHMYENSCGCCYKNNHTLSQNYCDSNNGDVSSGYVFKNSHTLSWY